MGFIEESGLDSLMLFPSASWRYSSGKNCCWMLRKIAFVAFRSSSGVGLVSRDLVLLVSLKILATILLALVHFEIEDNLWSRSRNAGLVLTCNTMRTSGSCLSSFGYVGGGTLKSGFHRNSGPVNQFDDLSLESGRPLEA